MQNDYARIVDEVCKCNKTHLEAEAKNTNGKKGRRSRNTKSKGRGSANSKSTANSQATNKSREPSEKQKQASVVETEQHHKESEQKRFNKGHMVQKKSQVTLQSIDGVQFVFSLR